MRYAILSDIHANLEALEAVLGQIAGLGVDQIISLGDLVGYNADPNECVRIVVEGKIPTLMGNHDAAACGLEEPVDFNPIARAAILWTRNALTARSREFLRSLPDERRLPGSVRVRLVHGSLLHRDHYLLSRRDVLENVRRMRSDPQGARILFFGHTHHQVAFRARDEDASVIESSRFEISEDGYYLINPGSVGQPRDRDPRASFIVYDQERRSVEVIRVQYRVADCSRKILAAGLPRELAARLSEGW
ncbi:MAG: metallophosphoesterase family protein [bacterium]